MQLRTRAVDYSLQRELLQMDHVDLLNVQLYLMTVNLALELLYAQPGVDGKWQKIIVIQVLRVATLHEKHDLQGITYIGLSPWSSATHAHTK